MKIFYRPHRGGLIEAINEKKFFDSLDDMLQYICESVKEFGVNIEPCDLLCDIYHEEADKRIGWNKGYIVTFKAYNDVKNKEAYLSWMGGKVYNHPCGVFGFYTDDYKENWEEIYHIFLNNLKESVHE